MKLKLRRIYVRLSPTEGFKDWKDLKRGGWSGVCFLYVRISGLVLISIGWDCYP